MQHPQVTAITVSVYYRQRTIQNTKQSIKQQEQKTWRQKMCTKRRLRWKHIRYEIVLSFPSTLRKLMLQTGHRALQKASPPQLFSSPHPTPKKRIKHTSTEKRGRNESKCTNERHTPHYELLQNSNLFFCVLFFRLTFSTVELVSFH